MAWKNACPYFCELSYNTCYTFLNRGRVALRSDVQFICVWSFFWLLHARIWWETITIFTRCARDWLLYLAIETAYRLYKAMASYNYLVGVDIYPRLTQQLSS